jgi:uncharacterized membrane protein YdjX (TVP38/TMEM64 family)
MDESPYAPPQKDGVDPSTKPPKSAAWKWIAAAIVVLVVVVLTFIFRERLSLENLARYESQMREFKDAYPAISFGAAFFIYVVVTALSLPGAAAMSIVIGWLFGADAVLAWPALLLVSFASTTGATLAFLLARYLLRDTIQRKFHDQLETFNAALEKEGAFYLFTLRLIPLVPFFVINAVMGLTPMRVWTYWWVSQLGMLPGTLVYVYAGSRVPHLSEIAEKGVRSIIDWQLLLAFALLGVLPLAIKKIVGVIRRKSGKAELRERTEDQGD